MRLPDQREERRVPSRHRCKNPRDRSIAMAALVVPRRFQRPFPLTGEVVAILASRIWAVVVPGEAMTPRFDVPERAALNVFGVHRAALNVFGVFWGSPAILMSSRSAERQADGCGYSSLRSIRGRWGRRVPDDILE